MFRFQVACAVAAAGVSSHCASPLPAAHQVSHSSAGAYEAALAATDTGFIASWYDVRDGNGEIYIRSVDGEGQPRGTEMRLTTNPAESYEPSIAAFPGGRIAVGWYDKAADGTLAVRIGLWTAAGKNRWSESSAASSVIAFSLFRGTTGVLSRGVDAASSQRLLAAPASG